MKRILFLWIIFSAPMLIGAEFDDRGDSRSARRALEQERKDVAACLASLEHIKPFSSTPITHVPQYVYATPTQVRECNWPHEYFTTIKGQVGKITRRGLLAKAKGDPEQYTKDAELRDWIYVCNLMEAHLAAPQKNLTIADLQVINAAVNRLCLTVEQPGKFRDKPIFWRNRELTLTENALMEYCTKNGLAIKEGTDPFFSTPLKDGKIPVESLRRFFTRCQETREFVLSSSQPKELAKLWSAPGYTPTDEDLKEVLDTNEITQWIEGQKKSGHHKEGYLDFPAWFLERAYVFPAPSTVVPALTEVLEDVNACSLHPIFRASKVLYDIVGIHPWEEGHKRTGRAASLEIFLRNGYLPPVIRKDEAEQYKQLFIDGFRSKSYRGLLNFVAFMGKKVEQAQQDPLLTSQVSK